MKKIRNIFVVALVALLVAFPVFSETQIAVLHVNDHHGQVLPTQKNEGGMEYEATYVKQIKERFQNVLYLSSGDINTGTALSNMFHAEPDIKIYNELGLDAATFGNHEFDFALSVLENQMELSQFPWVCANIKKGSQYLGVPYIIKEFDGIKVGIFGLTTRLTTRLEKPDESLTFTNEIQTAKQMVKILRNKEKCDLVILLGHLGDVLEANDQITSIELAQKVSGIDLIIDGHSHSYFAQPKVVNGTPIVTAFEKSKFVGTAIFTFDDDKKLTGFEWDAQKVGPEIFPADPEVTKIIAPYKEKADATLQQVILKTTAPFEYGAKLTRYQEMAVGDLVADSMVDIVGDLGYPVDFALINGGGIRGGLPQGDVTREKFYLMLPYESTILVSTLKGSDVIELFDFIATIKQGDGSFPQVSKACHFTRTYDENGNGTLSNLTINGKPIDKNKLYKIATIDFLAKGGDGYTALTKSVETYNSSMLLRDAVIDYAATLGTISPQTDGRITIVNGVELPQ